jgi:hypothetical protein
MSGLTHLHVQSASFLPAFIVGYTDGFSCCVVDVLEENLFTDEEALFPVFVGALEGVDMSGGG